MSSKFYHIQVTLTLAKTYKLNSCNEYDEHLIVTVYLFETDSADWYL